MKTQKNRYLLQLFAQEGEGVGGESAAPEGENAGQTPEENSAAVPEAAMNSDPAAEFEELIKGKFKDQYAERIQKTIDKRFRKAKEDEARLGALLPLVEKIAEIKRIPASDTAALLQALEGDASPEKREEESTEEEKKKLDEFRKKNEQLRERKNRFAGWMSQSEALQKKFSAFDFARQVASNPQFVALLNAGADVESAFKAANFDALMQEARNSAARQAKAALVSSVRSNGIRPVENGMASGTPAVRTPSPEKLSLGEINELFARAGRGEKITFR